MAKPVGTEETARQFAISAHAEMLLWMEVGFTREEAFEILVAKLSSYYAGWQERTYGDE